MAKKEKSNKISIYLIKKEVEYNKVLKEHVYEHKMQNKPNSDTFYLPSRNNKPTWLQDYYKLDNIDDISNSRSQVISLHKLIINSEERIFAIPFGNGKYLMNDEVIEEQFGIKILLNSVDKDDFRKINISNYGNDHRIKNEQMPKKTNINNFGFDVHNDFLRKASAKSEDEVFNKNVITGGDLFSVSIPVTIDNIDEFLKFCYERYLSDTYKKDFPWIDNIKEVKEKSVKLQLNELLLLEINNKNFDKIWMAVPEEVDWEKVSDFRFKKSKHGEDDIELSSFLNEFDNGIIPSFERLKSRKVFAMQHDDENPLEEWSAYNCLIGEVELNDEIYCLNFGKWYKVDDNFVENINQYYDAIPISDVVFPDSQNEREDEYNEKLKSSLIDSYLFDKRLVRIKGMGKSSIEVCDVLTKQNELIHVKKNGGSSYLSHLFNQAAVSGEFLLDESFRLEANSKIETNVFDNTFNPNKYKIILAIITKYNHDRPKIPFFSKVSIQYVIEGLKRKGYIVEIKNIPIIN